MRVLLDTRAFLWWGVDSPKLSARARDIIANPQNNLFLSVASGWEMAIKAGLGKLQTPGGLETFVSEQLSLNAIQVLPVALRHALHVYHLPQHHRDPFDRLLIAQSQLEQLPLLTSDHVFSSYAAKVLW